MFSLMYSMPCEGYQGEIELEKPVRDIQRWVNDTDGNAWYIWGYGIIQGGEQMVWAASEESLRGRFMAEYKPYKVKIHESDM